MKFHVPSGYDADKGDKMAESLMKKIIGLVNSEMAIHAATGATPEEVVAVAYDGTIRAVGQMVVNYSDDEEALKEIIWVKKHLKIYIKGITGRKTK